MSGVTFNKEEVVAVRKSGEFMGYIMPADDNNEWITTEELDKNTGGDMVYSVDLEVVKKKVWRC